MNEPVAKQILQRTIDIWNGISIMDSRFFLCIREETQGTFTRISIGNHNKTAKTRMIFMESFDTSLSMFGPASKEELQEKAYSRLLNGVLSAGLNQEFDRWDKGILEMDKNYQVTIHQFETKRID